MPRGFSLTELVITLLLLGLLASMAMPVYQQAVIKARRSDARITLYDYSQRLYQCLLSATTASACKNRGIVPEHSLQGFYKIRVTLLPDRQFELIAKPIQAQSRDKACGDYLLHSSRQRNISGYAGLQECW